MSQGPREDRALAYLMIGCLLVFIAQWPGMSRTAHLEGREFAMLAGYSFVGIMIVWPLIFYILTLGLYAVLRSLRWQIEPWQVRLATFWGFLAAAPAGLLYGLLVGFNGTTLGSQIIGAIWLGAIVIFAAQGLRAARLRDGN